jgi:hypothetical protein
MPGSLFYCILKDAVVNISQGCSLSCITVYTRYDKCVCNVYPILQPHICLGIYSYKVSFFSSVHYYFQEKEHQIDSPIADGQTD